MRQPRPTPSLTRSRAAQGSRPVEGVIEGEFWLVGRAVCLLIGGLVTLGWLLS